MDYDRFTEWVTRELRRRDWIQADFARHSGLSTATVSNVLSGKERPGLKFLEGTVQAFGYELADTILTEIGLRYPDPPEVADRREANRLFARLSDEEQEMLLTQMRALVERKRGNPRAVIETG
jgi:transcriptional regulator with XRE-family HTH domain